MSSGPHTQRTTSPIRRGYVSWFTSGHKHIFAKRKHLGITLTKLYWLLGVSLDSLWATNYYSTRSSLMIADAPWHVPNTILWQDLQILSVKEEIQCFSIHYSSHLQTHPNSLTVRLTEPPEHRRLKRHLPTDLITKFHELTYACCWNSAIPHATPDFCHY
jgi:hypothetical protein